MSGSKHRAFQTAFNRVCNSAAERVEQKEKISERAELASSEPGRGGLALLLAAATAEESATAALARDSELAGD